MNVDRETLARRLYETKRARAQVPGTLTWDSDADWVLEEFRTLADTVLAILEEQVPGTIEYMLRVPGEIPSGAIRATREEILEDKQYVEARWGKRDAVQRTVGPWTEVQS